MNVCYGWKPDVILNSIHPVNGILRPDGFAIGLLLFGTVMLFVPLMMMPGLVALVAAPVYWLTMVVAKVVLRRRN